MSGEALVPVTFPDGFVYAAVLSVPATLIVHAIERLVERLVLRDDHAALDPPDRRGAGTQGESGDR